MSRCPAPAVHRGGQLLLLIALVLGAALPARAQTLHLHADWIPDFTAPDSPIVCATGGAVGGYLRLRVRFQMPTGAMNASINSFTVHEVAGCYPDSGGTQGWEATTARPECGDPPGSGWRFWTLEWTPATAQLHNGPHELTVKVAYGGPMIGGPHYAQTSITLDLQNTLITATSPANPDPILWDPERMQGVPVSVTVKAAYRHAKKVTLRIFDSDQNEVRVLEQVTDVGGVRDGQVQASTVSFQWDGKNGMGQTMPRGVYLFRFQVTNEPNTPYDGDTDKSTFLTVSQTACASIDYDEDTDENTFEDKTVLTDAGDPRANASEAQVRVYDPNLDLVVGPVGMGTATNAPGAADPVWNVTTFRMVIGPPGVYTHLFAARDAHSAQDRGHRLRWALQRNRKPPHPLADCYDCIHTEGRTDVTARSWLRKVKDGGSYKARANGNATAGFIMGALPQDRVFFFYGHGTAPSGGSICTATQPIHAKRKDPNEQGCFLESLDLRYCLLAVYAACYSADTDPDHGCIMAQTHAQGAQCAVGFHGPGPLFVMNDPADFARWWTYLLWQALTNGIDSDGNPVTIAEALDHAKEVTNRWANDYLNTDDYDYVGDHRLAGDGALKIYPVR